VWDNECMDRLEQLEQIHRDARGTRRGRRWDTEQLNRSLFVALVGQFQVYCRELHDEATGVYLSQATATQGRTLGILLRQRRELDNRNPRRDALRRDFGRMGLDIIPGLQGLYGNADRDLGRLELLIAFRNAVVHGNESEVDALSRSQGITATVNSYRMFKRTMRWSRKNGQDVKVYTRP
jgi:hypothetical protein